jgi:hypothetical protein
MVILLAQHQTRPEFRPSRIPVRRTAPTVMGVKARFLRNGQDENVECISNSSATYAPSTYEQPSLETTYQSLLIEMLC